MGGFTLSFGKFHVPALVGGATPPPRFYSSERPAWLKYLRVYERAPAIRDPSILEVLADMFQLANRDAVDSTLKNYGVIGRWHPSSVLIDIFQDVAAARLLVGDSVPAYSLWNVALKHPFYRGSGFAIQFSNDEQRDRVLLPILVCQTWTDKEIERSRALYR